MKKTRKQERKYHQVCQQYIRVAYRQGDVQRHPDGQQPPGPVTALQHEDASEQRCYSDAENREVVTCQMRRPAREWDRATPDIQQAKRYEDHSDDDNVYGTLLWSLHLAVQTDVHANRSGRARRHSPMISRMASAGSPLSECHSGRGPESRSKRPTRAYSVSRPACDRDPSAAQIKGGALNSRSRWAGEAPCSRRTRTASACPAIAAQWRAVLPICSSPRFGSKPAASSASSALESPSSAARYIVA